VNIAHVQSEENAPHSLRLVQGEFDEDVCRVIRYDTTEEFNVD